MKTLITAAVALSLWGSFTLGRATYRPPQSDSLWFNRPPPKAILRGVVVIPVDDDAEIGGITIIPPLTAPAIDWTSPSNRLFLHDCWLMLNKDDVGPKFEDRWERE